MHRFLLINNNMAVSKLINASFKHIECEVSEICNYEELPLKPYLAIIIDSALYDKRYVEDLKSLSIYHSLIYLKKQNESLPNDFKIFLEKPFLPTGFISFINDIINGDSRLKEYVQEQKKYFIKKEKQDIQYGQNEQVETSSENILNKNDIDEIKNIMDDDLFKKEDRNTSVFDRVEHSSSKPYYHEEQKEIKKPVFENTSFNNLEEDELKQALQESNFLPKPIDTELVKGELQSAIMSSVALAMQSEVLKNALKGLKMNITITFEDKN